MCRRASEGTTNRVRIQEARFLSHEILLPPVSEQQRIVGGIEELAGKITEARSLQNGANDEREALWPAILQNTLSGNRSGGSTKTSETAEQLLLRSSKRHSLFMHTNHNNAYPDSPKIIKEGPIALPNGWIWTTLGSVLTHLVDCVNDTPNFVEIDTGLLGLKSTNVRPYKLDLGQRWYMSPDDFTRWNRREKPLPGDVILTRETPMGNACLVPENVNACLTQRLLLLRADDETIEPALLLHFLNSPIFQDQVRDQCRGLTTPHIRVQDSAEFLVPLPPKKEQKEIVRYLRSLRTDVDDLTALHSETAAALDALLPTVLDRAFKGEL
jgi:type I restriction enzyme S subunit